MTGPIQALNRTPATAGSPTTPSSEAAVQPRDDVSGIDFAAARSATPAITSKATPGTVPLASPDTVQLSYTDTGNPQGVPVIFIHAFPMNKAMWDDQLEALKKTNRVIAYDSRGFGQSGLSGPYTLESDVDDLIGLLDRLKIQKAVVCGLSMGGFVALRAVERNPERFAGLVLADTKSEPDSDASKLKRGQGLNDIRARGAGPFVDDFVTGALAPTDKPEIVQRAKSIAESNSAEGVSAGLLALTTRTDTTPGLSGIHVPTLIMNGEVDPIFPPAIAESMHEKIEGSSLYLIPGAGHLSNLENPTAFNARLETFLNSLKPSP